MLKNFAIAVSVTFIITVVPAYLLMVYICGGFCIFEWNPAARFCSGIIWFVLYLGLTSVFYTELEMERACGRR